MIRGSLTISEGHSRRRIAFGDCLNPTDDLIALPIELMLKLSYKRRGPLLVGFLKCLSRNDGNEPSDGGDRQKDRDGEYEE
jgi:hypothetical protein